MLTNLTGSAQQKLFLQKHRLPREKDLAKTYPELFKSMTWAN